MLRGMSVALLLSSMEAGKQATVGHHCISPSTRAVDRDWVRTMTLGGVSSAIDGNSRISHSP